jgi:hypothetical protein
MSQFILKISFHFLFLLAKKNIFLKLNKKNFFPFWLLSYCKIFLLFLNKILKRGKNLFF